MCKLNLKIRVYKKQTEVQEKDLMMFTKFAENEITQNKQASLCNEIHNVLDS